VQLGRFTGQVAAAGKHAAQRSQAHGAVEEAVVARWRKAPTAGAGAPGDGGRRDRSHMCVL
jgi:hypothetical protein